MAHRIPECYRGMLLANVAWGTNKQWTANWRSTQKLLTTFNDPDWSRQFHT